MLYYQEGGHVTHFGRRRQDFHPRWLCPDEPFLETHRRCERFESLADFAARRGPGLVCVHRTYALGDVIMLLPVLRCLHRRFGVDVLLATGSRVLAQIGQPGGGVRLTMSRGTDCLYPGALVHQDLDGCLEADHRGGEESQQHRVDLYARALGLEVR